jgi:heme-degrading monooxygenase HmoA
MAICRIVEPGATRDQYEQVRQHLGLGDGVPPGCQQHVAAVGDDGRVRVIEIWDSREQAEAFTKDQLIAAREAVGAGSGRPSITYLDVHHIAAPVGTRA